MFLMFCFAIGLMIISGMGWSIKDILITKHSIEPQLSLSCRDGVIVMCNWSKIQLHVMVI